MYKIMCSSPNTNQISNIKKNSNPISERGFLPTWTSRTVLNGDSRVTDIDELNRESLYRTRWGNKIGISTLEIKNKNDLHKIPEVFSKFVLNTDGTIFVMITDSTYKENPANRTIMAHSTMSNSRDGAVLSAGYIRKIDDVFQVTNASGHYTPSELSLYQVAERLNQIGCENIKITPFSTDTFR
ncbi:hypothetical protein [Pseudomonas koreensis]|uniref:hypothetical protein n=1 Tax=Pseudomonas koreensis TaxID=198620 RepID=UPI003F856315